MKRIVILFMSLLSLSIANANAEVGMSVNVGQPGFYGQIDIGDVYPAPRVIYSRPVIIHHHVYDDYEPIYLHVPPGHAKRWARYCDRYDACGRPVYFVNDRWYNEAYVPRYREYHEHGDDGRRFEHNDHGDRHDQDYEHGGKGHGKRKGHGRD